MSTTDENQQEIHVLDLIMAYEQGELDQDQTVVMFQRLIDTGLAWQLQGHYGREATMLLDQGVCHPPAQA